MKRYGSGMETRTANGLTLVLFSPSELGIYAKPVAGGFAPVSPATILRDADAVAALNGPMFDVCSGQAIPAGNAGYARSVCDVLEYRHQDGAVQARGSYPSRGMTFSVMGDSVVVQHGDQAVAGAKVAIQGYPPLVDSGQNVAMYSPNVDTVWRSALALMRDGRLALAIGNMPMPLFAARLLEAGATYAAYTDGGGSTALVTESGITGSSEHRPVPSWLVVRKTSNAGWWILGGVALATAWFLWG